MPIKPENRARYPADWPAISASIRARASNRCEWSCCHAGQYSVGRWVSIDGLMRWLPVEGNTPPTTAQDLAFFYAGEGCDHRGQPWTYKQARDFVGLWWWGEKHPIVIVLTVAHLNHDPADCRLENLRAMCQRHHLAYDHDHHRANSQATRRARAGTLELF